MTRLFEWKCIILDDQLGGVEAIRRHIAASGIRCTSGPAEDKKRLRMQVIGADLAKDIDDANVIFIDMQWVGDGRQGTDQDAQDIMFGAQRISPDVFRKWCDAYALAPAADTDERGDDRVGYTLGAAVSHLNPDAKLIFFTSRLKEDWDPLERTLQLFNPAPYAITIKDKASALKRANTAITALVRDLVAQNPEVHRWLVGQVILPIALRGEPTDGTCSEIWPGRPSGDQEAGEAWILQARKVLPQLHEARGWDLEGLIGLLPKLHWRLPLAGHRAIKGLQHDLAQLRGDPQKIAGNAVRLRAKCASAGVSGLRVLGPLQAAIDSPTRHAISIVMEAVARASRNDLTSLHQFCLDHDGGSGCDPDLRQPFRLERPETDASLPFDLFHLGLAVDALHDNLLRLEKRSPRSKVSAHITKNLVAVTYVDNSPGFADMAELAEGLRTSLAKPDALDRGLPLALAFPFSYPVKEMAVMTVDGSWLRLVPPANNARPDAGGKRPDDETEGWRFGVRWVFALDNAPG